MLAELMVICSADTTASEMVDSMAVYLDAAMVATKDASMAAHWEHCLAAYLALWMAERWDAKTV